MAIAHSGLDTSDEGINSSLQWSIPDSRPLAYAIGTPRLTVRCCEPPIDAAPMQAAIDASLDDLRQWIPWAGEEPMPVEKKTELLAAFQANFLARRDAAYVLIDRADDSFLGGAGLHPRRGPGVLEIGYWLRSDRTGRGYMTEAVAALTRVVLEYYRVPRAEIRCDPRNAASAAVPRRLGYSLERTLSAEAVDATGQPRDTMIWALTDMQYPASPAARVPIEVRNEHGELWSERVPQGRDGAHAQLEVLHAHPLVRSVGVLAGKPEAHQ
jgi:RimJ/RimL family protein N-acetyltransferase